MAGTAIAREQLRRDSGAKVTLQAPEKRPGRGSDSQGCALPTLQGDGGAVQNHQSPSEWSHDEEEFTSTIRENVVRSSPGLATPKVEVFDHYKTLGALKISAKGSHRRALFGAYDYGFPEIVEESSNYMQDTMKVLRADMNPDGPRRSHPSGDWRLPTRLVKVTGLMSEVISMRLCLGKDLPPGTRYLTLSHCWGGANIVKLTQGSLETFLSNIPKENLPQNVKDAGTDSAEDWEREAKMMGNIYRHSTCIIAAVAATNPHDGFFVERDSRSFIPCQIIPQSAQRRGGLYAENWRNRAGKEILTTRGWVCQERALSPHVLYFGTMMVSWKCTTASVTEVDTTWSSWSQKPGIQRKFYEILDDIKSGDYDKWSMKWWEICH
ncbi:hypothetical protein F5Y16DRAFT_401610 [Xylariaceae sp. FL0255]|nr:hypothetical protein F5Y16DRAFT_401610 [Xylariaceae sp. FL0255]